MPALALQAYGIQVLAGLIMEEEIEEPQEDG